MQFFGVGRGERKLSSIVKSSVGTADFGLLGGPRISFLPTLFKPQCLNVSIPRTRFVSYESCLKANNFKRWISWLVHR